MTGPAVLSQSGGKTPVEGIPALGILTKFVSAFPKVGESDQNRKLLSARALVRARRWVEQIETGDSRMIRFAQLAFLREHLPGGPKPEFRTKSCLAALRFDVDYLSLLYSHQAHAARFHGAMVCGSVWTCPVCAERITAVRRKELKKLLAITEFRVCLATLTLKHREGEALSPMVNALNSAIREMRKGRSWRRFEEKWGLVGTVSALEVTRGGNGWHPHKHMIFVMRPLEGKTGAEAKALYETEMQADLYALYHGQLNKAGRDCDQEHGVDVSANRRDYGDYLEKWGATEELTRSTRKQASGGGKSVWELLTDAVNGNERSWAQFLEYARAFKSKKQLVWSKGLRDLLALPEELTDEEAAEVATSPEKLVAAFSRHGLYFLRDHDLFGPVIRETERVEGDSELVLAYLARMGLRRFVASGEQVSPEGVR